MCVNEKEAILVHEALHDPTVHTVIVAGKKWAITKTSRGDSREVNIDGTLFTEQDNKPSRWRQKAKKGAKITWITPKGTPKGDVKGRIVDGIIETTCSAIDKTLRVEEDVKEPPKKKQKTHAPPPIEEIGTFTTTTMTTTTSSSQSKNTNTSALINSTTVPSTIVTPSPEVVDAVVATSASGLSATEDFSQGTGDETEPKMKKTKSVLRAPSDPLLAWQIEYAELTVGEQLGAGAFGAVMKGSYRCTDVAIKVLHSQEGKAQDMFRKEAELMCKIRHPYIIQCLGACITPPNCCIVMELLPSNLSRLIKESKIEIEFSIFHKVISGITSGLAFLHQMNPPIIHRDLKPGNILLDASNNPRIADFGVSREKSRTMTMTRIGTAQVLNGEYYNTKVDIYSFGMLVFAMIIRGTPWKDSNIGPVQVMMKVAKQERPPFPANTRADLQTLVTKCWQHSPDARPDAGACFDLIKRMRADNPNAGIPVAPPAALEPTQLISPTLVLDQTSAPPPPNYDATLAFTMAPPKAPAIFDDEPSNSTISSANSDSGSVFAKASGGSKHKITSSGSKQKIDDRPICRYDKDCYRKHPEHLKEFAHPEKEEHERNLNSYYNYLKTELEPGTISAANRKSLHSFRTAKTISLTEHKELLKKLNWSLEEFEEGCKRNKKRKRENEEQK